MITRYDRLGYDVTIRPIISDECSGILVKTPGKEFVLAMSEPASLYTLSEAKYISTSMNYRLPTYDECVIINDNLDEINSILSEYNYPKISGIYWVDNGDDKQMVYSSLKRSFTEEDRKNRHLVRLIIPACPNQTA